ncbi:helix-turn-helix transcriptional regulator [Eubacteriaceae bacterium Marseille-Q4139]|nr:helix-turn-helix transcriptional regulator [Eubacteriaceae bacterium Marseille-Q4139]
MTIAEKLYKLRNDTGLSQKEFADKIGASQSAVNYWENGNRQPRIAQIKKIAKAFDIALYILLDDSYELPNITSEAYQNSARFSGDIEMEKPPARFTMPRLNHSDQEEPELKLRTNDGIYNYEHFDELEYKGILLKLERGIKLSPQEIKFKADYEERELKKIGEIFAKFYALLNEKGRKKADEQIARVLEAIETLTKVPEYQKKPDD